MTARAWLLFATASVVWGVPYFFIKVAVDDDMPPALVAWSRVALGAAVLLPLALRRGALSGLEGRWRAICAYAACEIAVPFTLIAVGEQHVSSSLTAILVQGRLADLDPLGPVAVSLGVAGIALTPAAILFPPERTPSLEAIGSIVVLGVVCTAVGLIVFFQLIAEAGASRAAVITYVNPLVAVVLGVLVLDERLGATPVLGLALILAGSWLATRARIVR